MRGVIVAVFIYISVQVLAQNAAQDTIVPIGSKTTSYQTMEQFFLNRDSLETRDTLLKDVHRFEKTWGHGSVYQDLVGFGTASRPLYFSPFKKQGVQLGQEAYSLYGDQEDDILFFDTWSPFTNLKYYQGSNGFSTASIDFARSAGPFFTTGFSFQRATLIRQIGENPTREGYLDNWRGNAFAKFRAPSGRYNALVQYRYMKVEVNENGGTFLDSNDVATDSIFDEFENVNLSGIQVVDKRNSWNLYHEFILSDSGASIEISAFHKFDREKRVNSYADEALFTIRDDIEQANSDYYDNVYFGNAEVNDSSVYKAWVNKAGVAIRVPGQMGAVYLKNRTYSFWRNDTLLSVGNRENYAGFVLSGTLLNGLMPYYVNGEYGLDGFNRTEIKVSPKFFQIRLVSQVLPASVIQQSYTGTHFIWAKTFDNQGYTFAELKTRWEGTRWMVEPFVEGARLQNWIYFNEEALPDQAVESGLVVGYGATAQARLGKLVTSVFFKGYNSDNDTVWRAPKMYVEGQVYVEVPVPKRRLLMHIGADVRWWSSWNAMAFMPNTQQFFLQNESEVGNYPIVDVFLKAQLQTNSQIFVRWAHVSEGLFGSGYSWTPQYPGKPRSLEVGVNWQLFD